MISKERLDWLLGRHLPVQVIPAGFVAIREDREVTTPVEPTAHSTLGDLVIGDSHAVWDETAHIRGVHNEQIHHVDKANVSHHGVVSSPNRNALDAHLKSVSIWLHATPSVADDRPRPIYLHDVVTQAVSEVTGSSVADLLAARVAGETAGELPADLAVDYLTLLGGNADTVRDRAVAALEEKLLELETAEVIDSEDHEAIGPAWLIDGILRARAEDWSDTSGPEQQDQGNAAHLLARPGSVLTRFGPLAEGHDLSYSISDIGTIAQYQTKVYEPIGLRKTRAYGTTGLLRPSQVKETVTVRDGEVKLTMSHYVNQNGGLGAPQWVGVDLPYYFDPQHPEDYDWEHSPDSITSKLNYACNGIVSGAPHQDTFKFRMSLYGKKASNVVVQGTWSA